MQITHSHAFSTIIHVSTYGQLKHLRLYNGHLRYLAKLNLHMTAAELEMLTRKLKQLFTGPGMMQNLRAIRQKR